MVSPIFRYMLCMLVALPALSACTGKEVRSTFGLKRNNPDAFQVVSRPPLSVPPVYHLRPPAESEEQHITPADKRAEALVFEGRELPVYQRPEDHAYRPDTAVVNVETSNIGTAGESLLLRNAGAGQANPKIRNVLQAENAPIIIKEKQEKGFFERMTSKLRPGDGEPVVNARKEQDRLRANKADGKPVNEGDIPIIDPKDESVLDRLL